MKSAALAAFAALAVAAPAQAQTPPDHLGSYIPEPNASAVVEPFTIYHLPVDCMGVVSAFQADGVTELDLAGVPDGHRPGFKWADGQGGTVVYDDDADQFVSYSHQPVIAALWCSTVKGGSNVTGPAPTPTPTPEPEAVVEAPVAPVEAPLPASEPTPSPTPSPVASTPQKRSPMSAAKSKLRKRLRGYRVTCKRNVCVARKGSKRRVYRLTLHGQKVTIRRSSH